MLLQEIKTLFVVALFLISGTALGADEKKIDESKLVTAEKKGTNYRIDWLYQNFPAKISMYHLQNPRNARVGGMGRIKSKSNTIFANRISGSDVFVPEGDTLKFAIAVENTTNKKIYFNVVPHEITPEEFSLGTKFLCACFGHIYSVGPGQIWYRIVSLTNSTTKLGRNFTIRHKVIGLDADKSFNEAKKSAEE